jgi:hypothetical protein
MIVRIVHTTEVHIPGFHVAVDAVARERKLDERFGRGGKRSASNEVYQ